MRTHSRYPACMPKNPFGHIDLRVLDLPAALPLYDALMPELGLTGVRIGEGWKTFVGEREQPGNAFLPIQEDPRHVPNANRMAFWVESREEVERLARLVTAVGATVESGPRECPEYSATYYAVFFEDASGNKLEVYYRREP